MYSISISFRTNAAMKDYPVSETTGPTHPDILINEIDKLSLSNYL
jgi:hypothetical protein